MTYKEAKRILHPDTTREALAEIEFLGGFKGKEKLREAVDEAALRRVRRWTSRFRRRRTAALTEHGERLRKKPFCGKPVSIVYNSLDRVFKVYHTYGDDEYNCCIIDPILIDAVSLKDASDAWNRRVDNG